MACGQMKQAVKASDRVPALDAKSQIETPVARWRFGKASRNLEETRGFRAVFAKFVASRFVAWALLFMGVGREFVLPRTPQS